MKHQSKLIALSSLIALIIVISVILCAWCVNGTDEVTYSSAPRIYVCDSVWSDAEQYPPENIFGVCYIPLSVFSELEGVTIKENTNINNIMISHGDKYITFDLNNNKMYTQDGNENTVTTYLIYVGQRYVPAHIVCMCLGLSLETSGNAVRIGDGSEKLSFERLIEKYSSSSTETETSKVTEPEETVIPAADTTEREVAFTFTAGSYTEDILEILENYGVKATFFVDEDFIVNNYSSLRIIVAKGMEIGLRSEYNSDSGIFAANIERANKALYNLTKKNTRLYSSDKNSLRYIENSAELKSAMEEKGYVLVTVNNQMVYLPNTTVSIMEYDAEKFISNNELTVFAFPDDENTIKTLPLILKYISAKENITVRPITEGFMSEW